jgi:prophage tail gpP-like protein
VIAPHEISIAVGNEASWQWSNAVDSYDFTSDMLAAADSFRLRFRFDADMWNLCEKDNAVQVFIDGVRVYYGLIDDRERLKARGKNEIEIAGRDRGGRLLDESAPLFSLRGLGILDLARKIVPSPLKVVASNLENRRLLVGPRLKSHSKEPAIDTGKGAKRKVEPGESRWQILQHFLEEAGCLAWVTADGRSLVVGKPNYQQQPQWVFLCPKDDSPNASQGNVLELRRRESIAERYSKITVVGAYPNSTGTSYSWRDGPNDDGTGKTFRVPKRLIVQDDGIGSQKAAKTRAEREAAERDGQGTTLSIVVPGHGISFGDGSRPEVYCFDTIANVVDEDIGADERWYITRCTYSGSKSGVGQRTEIEMVPVGTDLRSVAG